MFADPNKHSKITLLSTFKAFCELAANHKFACFTSEANVAQKRRSAHNFASYVNRHQINTFTSTFAPWANETKIHSCTILLYKSGNL